MRFAILSPIYPYRGGIAQRPSKLFIVHRKHIDPRLLARQQDILAAFVDGNE